MRRVALSVLALLAPLAPASAASDCPGNPDAIGVSRTIEVDVEGGFFVGMQYKRKMPGLQPMEVILTYDDGPVPRNTERTLDALKAECTKATFFVVGRMARAYPDILHRTASEGHTIAYHTNTHPLGMVKWPLPRAFAEIEAGWRTVDEIVYGTSSDRPANRFFRYPGLFNSAKINDWLTAKDLGVFAADGTGNDWVRGYDGPKVLAFALAEMERQKGGILLLHDTKDSTSSITGQLLRELKKRGFKIVHMVPKEKPPAIGPAPVRGQPIATPAVTPMPAAGAVAPIPAALPAPGVKPAPLPAGVPARLPTPKPSQSDLDQRMRATFEVAADAQAAARKSMPDPIVTRSVAQAAPAPTPVPPSAPVAAAPPPPAEEPGFFRSIGKMLGF